MARLGSPWGPADQEHLIGGSLARSTAYMQAQGRTVPVAAGGHRPVAGRRAWPSWSGRAGVPLLPGAAGLLAEIAAAGIPYALVTSAEREIMDAALDGRSACSFPVTVCAADVTRSKPDPEPYLRAAALLGGRAGAVRGAGGLAHRDRPPRTRPGCAVIAVPSVPPPPGLARLTVPSLRVVDLATLRWSRGWPGPGRP